MDAKTHPMILAPLLMILGPVVLEAWILKFVARRPYDWRATLTSFAMFIGSVLSGLVPLFIAMPGAFWLYDHRLFEPQRIGAWSYVLLFLGVEFLYYWGHRLGHRVRWFWVTHGVHHSSNDLNLSTTVRNGWTDRIMANYIVYAPLALLGFDPQVVLADLAFGLAYQFWSPRRVDSQARTHRGHPEHSVGASRPSREQSRVRGPQLRAGVDDFRSAVRHVSAGA